jgi:hypothetical protein
MTRHPIPRYYVCSVAGCLNQARSSVWGPEGSQVCFCLDHLTEAALFHRNRVFGGVKLG